MQFQKFAKYCNGLGNVKIGHASLELYNFAKMQKLYISFLIPVPCRYLILLPKYQETTFCFLRDLIVRYMLMLYCYSIPNAQKKLYRSWKYMEWAVWCRSCQATRYSFDYCLQMYNHCYFNDHCCFISNSQNLIATYVKYIAQENMQAAILIYIFATYTAQQFPRPQLYRNRYYKNIVSLLISFCLLLWFIQYHLSVCHTPRQRQWAFCTQVSN